MRINKKIITVLDALKKERISRKKVADYLGIKPRTLRSYYAYFSGYRANKNDTPPKKEIVKKIRLLAQKKNIRTTIDIVNKDSVLEVILRYQFVYLDDLESGLSIKDITNVGNYITHISALKYTRLRNKRLLYRYFEQTLKNLFKKSSSKPALILDLNWSTREIYNNENT